MRFICSATVASLVAIPALACAAAPPPAESPPPVTQPAPEAPKEKLPEAREIIDRHVKAIDGEEAVRSKKSMHTKCKLSVPAQNMTGEIEVLAAAPDKLLVKSHQGGATTQAGFDGKVGWIIEPLSGPRIAQDKYLPELRERADFLAALRDPKHFKSMTNEGLVEFDKRQCYKITLVRHDDRPIAEYYDSQTGLFAGRTSKMDGPFGPVEQTITETEYKKFGDRLIATKTVQSVIGQEIITTVESVEFDTVEPSVFDLPPEVKALLEKPAEDKK